MISVMTIALPYCVTCISFHENVNTHVWIKYDFYWIPLHSHATCQVGSLMFRNEWMNERMNEWMNWGTGIWGLPRDLAILSPRCIKELFAVTETRMEDPQDDPLVVHCFCVCSSKCTVRDRSPWGKQIREMWSSVCSVLGPVVKVRGARAPCSHLSPLQ